ncbi:MAG: hypothetical protein AAGF54_03800 [Pseudomonadota bacterium]
MFEEAWLEEFGFSFEEFIAVLGAFRDLLEAKRQACVSISIVNLREYLTEKTGLSSESLDAFFDTFSLRPRSPWNEAPEGMLSSAWQPWRFQRQLSLVSRPIILLDDTEEAECIFAPAMVLEHLIKFATDARTGSIDQKFFRNNGKMFKWINMINGREGEAFNDIVADEFRNIGWKAVSNLSDGQLLNRRKKPSFGDVDVFAWDAETQRVLVIECKDLSFDKNMSEISKRLVKYRGEKRSNGKRDDLLKHIDRCVDIEDNIAELRNTTGFDVKEIERVIVFSQPTPMQFSDITGKHSIKVCTLKDIEEVYRL